MWSRTIWLIAAASPLNAAVLPGDSLVAVLAVFADDEHALAARATVPSTATSRTVRLPSIAPGR
jgi:hypothetical protein